MTNIDNDDDLESEAIFKCAKALKPLSDEAKIRVVKHIVERFNLSSQQTNSPVIRQDENSFKSNVKNDTILLPSLLIGETNQVISDNGTVKMEDLPSVRDVVIRNLHSSEPELLLVIAFYASNSSKETFSRQKLIEIYKTSGYYNTQRRKSLTLCIQSLIKQSALKSVSDNEYTLLSQGLEKAKEILSGNHTSKPRKPSTPKKKAKTNKPKADSNE